METINELDQILKNTEFENTQQFKSIENEKEKIQAYEEKINDWELTMVRLRAEINARDEQRVNLSKQHANNRANIDSLKQTSLVLADHEEALKKKLQHNLEKLEHDRVEQTSALAKYRIIWERYETFYDSMEQVHEAKQKKEELESLKEQSTVLEVRINELEATLKQVRREKEMEKLLIPWIVKIATLRADTNKNVSKSQDQKSLVLSMQAKIRQLQEERTDREQSRLKQLAIAREVEYLERNTEGMPRSCVEPLEHAVQPLMITEESSNSTPFPPNLPSSAPTTKERVISPHFLLSSDGGPRKGDHDMYFPPSAPVPPKPSPSPSPRYRLELPQLSYPSRRNKSHQTSLLSKTSIGVPSAMVPSTVMSSVPTFVLTEPVEQQASASNTTTDAPQVSISQPPTRQNAMGGTTGRLKPSPLHVSYTQPISGTQMQVEHQPQITAQLPEASVPPQGTDRGTERDDFQFKVPTKAIRHIRVSSSTGTNDIQPIDGKNSRDCHIPHGQSSGTTESSADDMEWNSNSASNVVATSLPSQLTTSPPPATSLTIASAVTGNEGGACLPQVADTAGIASQVDAANLEHPRQEAEYQDTQYGQYSQQHSQGQMEQALAVCRQGEPEAQGCRVEGQEAQYGVQEGQNRPVQYRQGHEQEIQYRQAQHGQLGSGQEQQYAQQPQQQELQYEQQQYGQQHNTQQQQQQELQYEQQQYGQQHNTQQQANQDFSNNQFDAEKAFGFGGFEQSAGGFGQSAGAAAGGFGGGFGLFGGQQENAESSSFGAGFSFGSSPSQDNNSSGFSFGNDQSAGSGSKFSMFNF